MPNHVVQSVTPCTAWMKFVTTRLGTGKCHSLSLTSSTTVKVDKSPRMLISLISCPLLHSRVVAKLLLFVSFCQVIFCHVSVFSQRRLSRLHLYRLHLYRLHSCGLLAGPTSPSGWSHSSYQLLRAMTPVSCKSSHADLSKGYSMSIAPPKSMIVVQVLWIRPRLTFDLYQRYTPYVKEATFASPLLAMHTGLHYLVHGQQPIDQPSSMLASSALASSYNMSCTNVQIHIGA